MFLEGHYQNAYVTHDLDQAMAELDGRYGEIEWIRFDPEMTLKTPSGDKEASLRVAVGWAGGLNLELIQPVSGWYEAYAPFLPADKSDPTPHFHHIAMRREDEDAMRAEIAELGLPLAFEGGMPGLTFIYLDGRESLGHYLEFVWGDANFWASQAWPKDRPIW